SCGLGIERRILQRQLLLSFRPRNLGSKKKSQHSICKLPWHPGWYQRALCRFEPAARQPALQLVGGPGGCAYTRTAEPKIEWLAHFLHPRCAQRLLKVWLCT